MFCYQCEQAAKGEGCTVLGVCGKNPEVAALQDLLIYSLQGCRRWPWKAAKSASATGMSTSLPAKRRFPP